MNNIPTAEEFRKKRKTILINDTDIMISFAKLHVEACKKEIEEAVRLKGGNISTCNLILNTYPLTKIK